MPGPGNDLIDDDELAAVTRVLRSGYLGRYGPDDDPDFTAQVLTVERRIAELAGVSHALALGSGTSALWILLCSLGIGPGDEVIVPGFTFVASMSSIVYTGAAPVLAEVDDSFNLDPADVEARITPRTKAILAVHMLGAPCDLDALADVAARHDVVLVEDAAQAFGGSYHGRPLGSVGVAGAYSFNIYKTITCGDGGMLVTSDDELYERCFALHDQGHLPLRRGVEIGSRPFLGLNFRMNELSGAVLNAQLGKLDRILVTLRANKAALKSRLGEIPGLGFRRLTDPDGEIATHLVVTMPDAPTAKSVAAELGTKPLSDSGWHVYGNMEHLLRKRVVSSFAGSVADYVAAPGVLPATDALLARSITLGIGVVDPGLGSAYGIDVRSDATAIDDVAARVADVVGQHVS